MDSRAPFEVQNITGAQFLEIYNGVTCAGMKLIFGLNLNNRVNGQWDTENVELLLQFIKEHNLKLTLELGNEPNSYHHKFGYWMSPEQHMLDLGKLKDLLKKYSLSLPVFGPDTTGRSQQAFEYLDQFIHLVPSLEAYTYHHYSLSGYSSNASDYLKTSSFRLFENEVKKWSKLTDRPLMLGETAVSYGLGSVHCLSVNTILRGGQEGITNRWLGSFLWADKLGLAATNGIRSVMRGNFSL